MRRVRFLFLAVSAMAVTFGVSSCGEAPVSPQADFDFTVELLSKRNKIYLNEYKDKGIRDRIDIHEINKKSGVTYKYEYKVKGSAAKSYVEVDSDGYLTPIKLTDETVSTIQIQIYESTTELMRTLPIKIVNKAEEANRGANYSSDKAEKNVILGQLESYAMNNFLTGITLFENGGWVRYSDRVTLGSETYIPGFGFGLLSEGSLDPSKPLAGVTDSWKSYLRSASSSETYSINAWDSEGSQISDLNSYITSSFWSTKIGPSGTDYVWYPCLAANTVTRYKLDAAGSEEVQNNRPVPVDDKGNLIKFDSEAKNENGLYRRWRVYVKTSEIKYRTMAENGYNNRAVKLEDYVFPFKMLLTQAAGTFRGAELASDTSYGFKGGYSYFRKTKDVTEAAANEEWDRMTTPVDGVAELGIYTGTSDELGNGEYIEFEFINPIDDFTAMYTLSSNLYSPLPEEFLHDLPGTKNGWVGAAKLYGKYGAKPDSEDDTHWFRRNMLCVGPFYLERWDTTSQVIFKLNEDWWEVGPRYHIPGVHITIESKATKDPDHIWGLFNLGKLDSAGIPKSYLENNKVPKTGFHDYQTKGDSTFKLNVNSCTQERSDYLFGKQGVIEKHDTPRTVKPWMSNNNFLQGLFWSIKRKDFADALGVNPSYEYFADAYLTDIKNPSYNPETDPKENEFKTVAYNTTNEHKDALRSFGLDPDITDPNDPEKYGYSPSTSVIKFQSAVSELLANGGIKALGTKNNPKVITIDIWWMYQSEIEEYGKDIKNYFEEAFNNNAVANGCLKLDVNNEFVTDWQDVYKKHLMTGEFDLGFGAISGNTLNPLNFLEVLRSDNSSGFTLNWGADTSKKSDAFPIIYDNQEWTFDSLWAAGDHGVVAKDGEEVKPVKEGYMKAPRQLDDPSKEIVGGDLSHGGILYIPFSFVDVSDGVDFEITKIQVYLPGTDNLIITKEDAELKIVKDESGKVIRLEVTISKSVGEDINARLIEANDLEEAAEEEKDPEKKADILLPFKYKKYDLYWSVEVYFNLKIAGAMPVENVFYIAKNSSDDDDRSFARMF